MKCKKCNVYLADYLTKCPLCNEEVENISDNTAYSNVVENFSTRVNAIYFSRLIMKLLILSSIICMVCNLIINKKVSWSLYAITSSMYVCSYYLYIILNSKKVAFILNMISLEILLFMISYLTNSTSWFIYLVGPFILLVLGFILLILYLYKYRNVLRNFSCILIYISCALNIINGCILLFKGKSFIFTWSIYASIPLLIISFILMILSFNEKIADEIEKRFFI